MCLYKVQCYSLERLLSGSFFFIIYSKWKQIWLILAMTSPTIIADFLCFSCNQNNPAPNTGPQKVTTHSKDRNSPWLADPSEVLCQKLSLLCPFSGRSKYLEWPRTSQESQGEVQLLKSCSMISWEVHSQARGDSLLALPTLRTPTCLLRELPPEASKLSVCSM